MNETGNTWVAVGKRKVGKTHTVMEMAQELHDRMEVPKSIIVFDHTNNSSYNKFGLRPLTMEHLPYLHPDNLVRGIVRVDRSRVDEFCDIVSNCLERCSVIFDDCGVIFRGNLSGAREAMLKTPANNGIELFFQAHRLAEIGPSLLAQANMYILKQTVDNLDSLPDKVIAKREIVYLMREVIRQNLPLPANRKWSTRIYDTEEDEIWLPGADGHMEIISGDDYFEYSDAYKYRQSFKQSNP